MILGAGDPALRNIVGIAQANPELALKGIRLRKFGQEISVMSIRFGRAIAPRFIFRINHLNIGNVCATQEINNPPSG